MPATLDRLSMSKPVISRLFKIALAFVVAGSASATAVALWALANGIVSIGGPQVISFDPATAAGAVLGFAVASLLTCLGSAAAVVAWGAALVNTARLADKAWFVALLGLGLVSLGWLAMVAYVLVGPDGTTSSASRA